MIEEKIQYPVITLSILYFYYNKDERIVSLRQLQHIADKLTKRSYIEVDNVVTYEKFYSYFISHESYFKERGPYLFELINSQVWAENIEAINILMEFHPNLELVEGYDGATPLMAACSKGRLDIIETLLLHRANINKKDNNGKDVYYYADLSNNPDEVKSLLKKFQ